MVETEEVVFKRRARGITSTLAIVALWAMLQYGDQWHCTFSSRRVVLL